MDDLRAILVLNHPLTFANDQVSLPDKYQHMLHLETVLKVTQAHEDYNLDEIVTVYPKRLKTGRKGYVQSNAYQQASVDYAHYQLDKDTLYVYVDKAIVQSGKMDYLETPADVYLNPDKTVDYNDPVNNSTLQFPDHVCYEIVKVCKRIFIENIESQRYGTSVQEEQIRKQAE